MNTIYHDADHILIFLIEQLITWTRTLLIDTLKKIFYIWILIDFKVKILYFDINSNLSQIYNIVFHCLWLMIRCLCGNIWILAVLERLEFWHEHSLIYFGYGKPDTPTKVGENSGQKLVIFAYEWDLREGHYDVVVLFTLPNEIWNGMYQSRRQSFLITAAVTTSDH